MSNETRLEHENFRIEAERFKIVRDTRREPSMPCYLELDQQKFKVNDYSTFGVSIITNESVSREVFDNCVFSYGPLGIEKLTLRHVRSQEMPEGRQKHGFEIISGEIDTILISTFKTAKATLENVKNEIAGDGEIPISFQVMTLALKSKFDKISRIINDASNALKNQSKSQKIADIEEIYADYFSRYLHDVILDLLNNLEKTLAGTTREVQIKAHQFFRAELGQYIFSSPFVERVYKKPYGYAGDFEMMNLIYNKELLGDNLFAKCLNRAILETPASKAVRNRSEYLYRKLKNLLEINPDSTIRVLSVASGPAREVQLLIKRDPHLAKRLVVDLLDQDLRSLKMAKVVFARLCREMEIELPINYFNLAIKNILEHGLSTGPYDMIYSAGLFDYFSDPVARLAASNLYKFLKPGAELVVGNFNEINPSRFLMECVGDWHLIHRSVKSMTDLFNSITPNLRIEMEEENVNLFAVLVR